MTPNKTTADPVAEAKPAFHPIRTHLRRKASDAEPAGADAEREPVQAEREPVAAADPAPVETAASDAPAELVQAAEPVRAESATAKAARLKREIEAAEIVRGEITSELAGLALGCESGDAESLARRRALREARAALADRIADKQAALAAVLPLADAERAEGSKAQRDAAFAEAETLLGYAEGWAQAADRAIYDLARALDGHRQAQAAWVAATQRHVPQGSHWLCEQDASTLESVLLARMVYLGLLDPRYRPGVLLTGRTGLADAVRDHTTSVRARLASIVRESDRPPAPAAEWIAGTGAVPWSITDGEVRANRNAARAERVNPLVDALARSA